MNVPDFLEMDARTMLARKLHRCALRQAVVCVGVFALGLGVTWTSFSWTTVVWGVVAAVTGGLASSNAFQLVTHTHALLQRNLELCQEFTEELQRETQE